MYRLVCVLPDRIVSRRRRMSASNSRGVYSLAYVLPDRLLSRRSRLTTQELLRNVQAGLCPT